MKVIDIINKISKGEEIKDFTVDDGERIFGVINGILVDKVEKQIVSWKISEGWLNSEVNFVNTEKEDEDVHEYIINFIDEIIKEIF